MKNKDSKWTFAKVKDVDIAAFPMPSLDDLYRVSLNSREAKRKMLNDALNAALENLMSWERVARADGFVVECMTDAHNGEPHPVFEDCGIRFVQAYGVCVREPEKEGEK